MNRRVCNTHRLHRREVGRRDLRDISQLSQTRISDSISRKEEFKKRFSSLCPFFRCFYEIALTFSYADTLQSIYYNLLMSVVDAEAPQFPLPAAFTSTRHTTTQKRKLVKVWNSTLSSSFLLSHERVGTSSAYWRIPDIRSNEVLVHHRPPSSWPPGIRRRSHRNHGSIPEVCGLSTLVYRSHSSQRFYQNTLGAAYLAQRSIRSWIRFHRQYLVQWSLPLVTLL